MRCELIDARGRPPELTAARLRELVAAGQSVRERVADIVASVRVGGDEAVRAYTERFDTAGAPAPALRVEEPALERAVSGLDRQVRAALELAIANVRRVAEAGLRDDVTVSFDDGHEVILREAPVARAAVYVPGGRAPYPSTVVMGVVTAVAAGVREIAVCSPPGIEGELDPTVLAACRLAGAETVYRMGGAQSIAALAFGTESVEAVDVIVGPGNLYVQEAKQQVFGQVGIDGFAGPSDLVAIVGLDGPADGPGPARLAETVAEDLLAQAEHGEATIVAALSPERALLEHIGRHLGQAPETGAVARLVQSADPREALAVAQAFAPEHLQLIGPGAERLAPEATHAGCVFVGLAGATAFGDYVAGSNHILPTGGAARFASALSPAHFRRRFTEVRIGRAAGALAPAGAAIARAEGFERHARSMEVRIRDNGAHEPHG